MTSGFLDDWWFIWAYHRFLLETFSPFKKKGKFNTALLLYLCHRLYKFCPVANLCSWETVQLKFCPVLNLSSFATEAKIHGVIILPHLVAISVHSLDVEHNALMTAKYKKEGFNARLPTTDKCLFCFDEHGQKGHRRENYFFYFINTDQCEKIRRRYMLHREKQNPFLRPV